MPGFFDGRPFAKPKQVPISKLKQAEEDTSTCSSLLKQYRRVEDEDIKALGISEDHFLSAISKSLARANRDSKGVQGGLSYASEVLQGDEKRASIEGRASHLYFMGPGQIAVYTGEPTVPFFMSQPEVAPSMALKAFFTGPTIADCGSVLEASLYAAILEMIGTNTFNTVFSSPMTPFCITPMLWLERQKDKNLPLLQVKYSNPLFNLFDDVEKTLETIEPGDFVHIQGVKDYDQKHLSGSMGGENLLCTGHNDAGDPLFLGFGREKFPVPLNYAGVKQLLINGYNKAQDTDTKGLIKRGMEHDDIVIKGQSSLAASLAKDELSQDAPIVGIVRHKRLNMDKLRAFIARRTQQASPQLDTALVSTLPSIIKKPNLHAKAKVHGLTLKDLAAQSPTQEQMIRQGITSINRFLRDKSQPRVLIFSGEAGVGKTMIAQATMNSATAAGLGVAYLDEYMIWDFLEKGQGELNELLKADVILLDDINVRCSHREELVLKIIRYCIDHNKFLIMTSNSSVKPLISEALEYPDWGSSLHDCVLFTEKVKEPSLRQAWYFGLNLAEKPIDDQLKVMCEQVGSAGLILSAEEKSNPMVQELMSSPKTYTVGEDILSYPTNYDVFYLDMTHSHDKTSEKYIPLIKIEQFLKLVTHCFNYNKKLLITTDVTKNLIQEISDKLNLENSGNKARLLDRMRVMLYCSVPDAFANKPDSFSPPPLVSASQSSFGVSTRDIIIEQKYLFPLEDDEETIQTSQSSFGVSTRVSSFVKQFPLEDPFFADEFIAWSTTGVKENYEKIDESVRDVPMSENSRELVVSTKSPNHKVNLSEIEVDQIDASVPHAFANKPNNTHQQVALNLSRHDGDLSEEEAKQIVSRLFKTNFFEKLLKKVPKELVVYRDKPDAFANKPS